MIPSDRYLKRTLWLYLGGTRGGKARLDILLLLKDRPSNINQVASAVGLDYTTVMYHMRILEKNGLVSPEKRKYGSVYFLSPSIEANFQVLEEIAANIGKGLKKDGRK